MELYGILYYRSWAIAELILLKMHGFGLLLDMPLPGIVYFSAPAPAIWWWQH